VDVEAERDRLAGAIGVLEREIARAEGMLGNPRFVDRAPEDVVTKEREKLARFTAEREELSRRLSELR
jgi:valyl-tRNA synthetase